MRKLLVVALVVVLSGTAAAQQRRGGRRPSDYRSFGRVLPGGYALITRVTLTEEQKKLLTEVYTEYETAYRAAARAAAGKLPRMEREDWRDPVKRAEWDRQRRAAMAKSAPKPPIEKVSNVLTPDQLGKVLNANTAYEKWIEWLAGYLVKMEAELAEAAGAKPDKADPARRQLFAGLARLLDGADMLERVGLTDEQVAELTKLRAAYVAQYTSLTALVRPSTRSDKLTREQTNAAEDALSGRAVDQLRDEYRAKVEAVLTKEQKAKLAKAGEVLKVHETEVAKKYVAYVAEVDKLLPAPKGSGPGMDPRARMRRPR